VNTDKPGPLQRARQLRSRPAVALLGGGALTAVAVWLATSPMAAILEQATGNSEASGQLGGQGPNIIVVVNNLLGPALIIVVALAPLAIAWGAGMMIFGGRHGPQIMGGTIVAVVLVAAARGIAA
jgi:hypothetical protein